MYILKELFDFIQNKGSLGNILLSIIAGLIVIGFQNLTTWSQILFKNILLINKVNYRYNGYWINLEKYENVEIKSGENKFIRVNINKMAESNSIVKFTLWQYSNEKINVVKKYLANGITMGKSGPISVYYYIVDSTIPETGACTLKLDGQRLVGNYVQYTVERKISELIFGPEGYSLIRISLPISKRLKMFFGIKPFKNYYEVEEFLKQLSLYDDFI